MKYFLGYLLFLVACNTPPMMEPEKAQVSRPEASTIAPNVSSIYTYFLIPSQALLDAEYDNLRNNLEYLSTPQSQLRKRAFEEAAGMIASMLDTKYGNHVQGEVLPSSQVIIVKSDQELDLSVLKDLIVDLDEEHD